MARGCAEWRRWFGSVVSSVLVSSVAIAGGWTEMAQAEPPAGAVGESSPTKHPVRLVSQQLDRPLISAEPLQNYPSPSLKALLKGVIPAGWVTSKNPSLLQLSVPSLWWIRDQLADLQPFGKKFIQEWIAYPRQNGQPGQVDLLVNRQQWSLLDYLQRYEFVNKFSAIARRYGYNTRVYDNPDRLPVALYLCDFSAVADQLQQESAQPLRWTSTDQLTHLDQSIQPLGCDLNMPGLHRRRP